MSLKLKTLFLFLLFILVVSGVFLLQLYSYQQLSDEMIGLNESHLPQQQFADVLFESFERIDSALQFAVLTAEYILVDNARDEITLFRRNLERLQVEVPSVEDGLVQRIRKLSTDYFSNAIDLAIAIIELEDRPNDNTTDFDTLSEKTSVFREQLRSELTNYRQDQTGELISTLDLIASQSQERLFQSLLLSAIALTSLGAILYISIRSILGSIALLSSSLRQITAGDYEMAEELETTRKDEIGLLSRSFNEMLGSLRETTVSRNYFDRIIQSMADMLFVCDEEKTITLVNQSVSQQLGFESKELLDHNFSNFVELDLQSLDMERMDQDELRVETRVMNKWGAKIPVVLSASTIQYSGSSSRRLVFVASNITAQKRAEEAEREAKLSAIEKQQLQEDRMTSISILVSGVAHEINNPNHMILSNIAFLKKAWLSSLPILLEAQEDDSVTIAGMPLERAVTLIPEALSIIRGGSERIKTIVKELRDYARAEPVETTDLIDINEILNSAVTLMSNMIKSATSDFTVELHDQPLMIYGNYQKLEQVVINLIANACQALSSNQQSITVKSGASETSVYFEIRDTGVGMDTEMLRHIFDPFFTTKRESGGTGLGLSISHQIVSEHGGELTADSRPAEGTAMIVTLPDHIHSSQAKEQKQ